ncbi:hypothetical protein [Halobellus salinus]|nr:hypothetical protein [Halobellus salinus]
MVLPQALSHTALAVVAASVGGVVAIYRPPGPQMESSVQHFAAGVVTLAVATLPEVHERAPAVVVFGFPAGVVTILGSHRLSGAVERRGVDGQFAGAAGRDGGGQETRGPGGLRATPRVGGDRRRTPA